MRSHRTLKPISRIPEEMMTKARICFLIVFASLFIGNACGRDFVNKLAVMLYEPYNPAQQLDSSIPETKNIVWEKLVFNPTLPHKPLAVGVIQNDFGNEAANVWIKDQPPEEWLAEAAKLEFKNAGLDVGDQNPDDPRISIVVEQFFAEATPASTISVTILDVRVALPKQGKMFQRRFVGEKFGIPFFYNQVSFILLKSAQLAFHEAAQETRKLIDMEVS